MLSNDMIDLYDAHMNDELSRREFLEKLAVVAGGVAAAYAVLPLLESNDALAETIAAADPRLQASMVPFPTGNGSMQAYQAQPKESGTHPAILVIHENRGLNPHIEDIARRLGVEGYLSFAPDALSLQGGTPDDPDKARDMIRALDMRQTIDNFAAAAAYLRTTPQSTGKVGVVGFCWGGALANQLAVHSPDVTAVVSYYGRQPAAEDVETIKASLLLHYAGLDERVNEGIEAFEDALEAQGVDYELHMYEGAQHAFNNDTNSARYNEQAATLAWRRTLDFFQEKLKG